MPAGSSVERELRGLLQPLDVDDVQGRRPAGEGDRVGHGVQATPAAGAVGGRRARRLTLHRLEASSSRGMPDDDHLLTIGALARRTGLAVRTIRFYSDEGLVPEAARSEAGHRRYDAQAVRRLRLVRTLRELGVGLDDVRHVLTGARTVAEVAAAHAAAVDAQIATLRLQRSVLRAVAARPGHAEELDVMHDLATLSADERRRIVGDFIAEAFGGLPDDAGVRARMEAAPPDLPDDPAPEQVDAWVELARLVQDPAFRARVRQMAERAAAAQAPGIGAQPAVGRAVGEHAGAAVAARIDPAADAALPVLERVLAVAGDPPDRAALAEELEAFTDRRAQRYWTLVGIIRGWPPVPDVVPAWEWFAAALRAHPRG